MMLGVPNSCADPEGGGGIGGPDTPTGNHKLDGCL